MTTPAPHRTAHKPRDLDWGLIWILCTLLTLGLIAVGSASFAVAEAEFGQPFHFVIRQGLHLVVGGLVILAITRVPLRVVQRLGPWLLLLAVVMLLLVFAPGLGQEVNGSLRWLRVGPVNIQVSELARLSVVVYMAGYMVRRIHELRSSTAGFLKPMVITVVVGTLMVLQPDFGAATVLLATVMAMMFLGGVRLLPFGVLLSLVTTALTLLAVFEPYRLRRLTSFLNPWADPFNSGFQLTQSLIAFGRGEVFGAGLGESVQKLFYLPEPHTDFLYAVMAEELGLVGSVGVIVLFALLVMRIFAVGRRAERKGAFFGAFLAYGIGVWIALQTFVNLGVNMGILPTKGLTLPFMSYGGSSLVMSCAAIALVLRVDLEARNPATVRDPDPPLPGDDLPVHYAS
jgi:cell division protein FtsW